VLEKCRTYWIEAEFALLRYALNGIDAGTRQEQNAAIAVYLRWRNIPHNPKPRSLPTSPNHAWTHFRPMCVTSH
jgi:hypothetical protein